MKTFVSVAEAKALVAEGLPAPRLARLSLARAAGHVLARDLVARESLPAFANSAMDGYAVRAADVAGATPERPRTLPLAGEIAAGAAPGAAWPAGSVLRIMTGAPVPDGCDGVIPVERTEEADGAVRFLADLGATGPNLRPAGEDVTAGAPLLAAGARLTPAALALLAAQGFARVPVWRRPRVALLATGDELRPVGASLEPGQIRNSNVPMAVALLAESGFTALDLGVAPDAPGPLRALLARGLAEADVLVSSGGVSMGRYDLVGTLLAEMGATWVFHKVRQQPGGPLALLRWEGRPVFGLPGNPVSTFMTLWYYVLPALRRMAGDPEPEPRVVRARLAEAIAGRPVKQFFARAALRRVEDGWEATPRPPHGSHVLSSLAASNAFLLLLPDCGRLEAGAEVDAALLAPC